MSERAFALGGRAFTIGRRAFMVRARTWVVLLAVGCALCQLAAVTGRATPDTKNYVSYALTLGGAGVRESAAGTIDHYCGSRTATAERDRSVDVVRLRAPSPAGRVAEKCRRELWQDLLTDHFTRPDRARPWPEFLRLEVGFWAEWGRRRLTQPLFLAALAAGAWGAVRQRPVFGWFVVAGACTGLLNQAGHPDITIWGDRLIVVAWLLPVLGLPLLLERLTAPRASLDVVTAS